MMSRDREITIIIKKCCEYYNASFSHIINGVIYRHCRKGSEEASLMSRNEIARQAICFIANTNYGFSFKEIAKYVKRNERWANSAWSRYHFKITSDKLSERDAKLFIVNSINSKIENDLLPTSFS